VLTEQELDIRGLNTIADALRKQPSPFLFEPGALRSGADFRNKPGRCRFAGPG